MWQIWTKSTLRVISQLAVLQMPSFSVDTRSMSSSPLVNSLVKNWLFRPHQTSMSPRFTSSTLGFVCGRHDAAWQPRSCNPQDWDLGCLDKSLGTRKFSISWRSSSTVARARHTVPVRCPAGTKLLPDTLYRWQQYDVIMTSWSSVEEVNITRVSCFVESVQWTHTNNTKYC